MSGRRSRRFISATSSMGLFPVDLESFNVGPPAQDLGVRVGDRVGRDGVESLFGGGEDGGVVDATGGEGEDGAGCGGGLWGEEIGVDVLVGGGLWDGGGRG